MTRRRILIAIACTPMVVAVVAYCAAVARAVRALGRARRRIAEIEARPSLGERLSEETERFLGHECVDPLRLHAADEIGAR